MNDDIASIIVQAERMKTKLSTLESLDCRVSLVSESEAICRRQPDDLGKLPSIISIRTEKLNGASLIPSSGIKYLPKIPVDKDEVEASKCPRLFNRAGKLLLNDDGENRFLDGGRQVTHYLILLGRDSESAKGLFAELGHWAFNNADLFLDIIGINGSIRIQDGFGLWLDFASCLAANDPTSTIRPAEPKIALNESFTVSVSVWKRLLTGQPLLPSLATGIKELIGDEPQDWFTESESVVQDSLEGINLLIDALKREQGKQEPEAIPAKPKAKRRKPQPTETEAYWEQLQRKYQSFTKPKGSKSKMRSFKEGLDGLESMPLDKFKSELEAARGRIRRRTDWAQL